MSPSPAQWLSQLMTGVARLVSDHNAASSPVSGNWPAGGCDAVWAFADRAHGVW
ncbi:hypothetical protein NG2371_06778 [Nocardia gamkensis]|nr:hypothetical protein [Nocardia gamkensis]